MPISPEQLAELIDRHWGPLMIWVGNDGDGAEDFVQQAFVALSGLKAQPNNPVAWLYTAARNRAINARLQQRRRGERHLRAAKPEVTNQPNDSALDATELNQILFEFPHEIREVIVARIWGEFSFEEIANLTGRSKATVWRQFESALLKLRSIYGVSNEVAP